MVGLHSVYLLMPQMFSTLCGRVCDRQSSGDAYAYLTGIPGLVAVLRDYEVAGSALESLSENSDIQIVKFAVILST